MRVLIIGASGLVGKNLLKSLLSDRRVASVTSLGRKILDVSSPKLSQIQIDLRHLENLDLPESDVAFCCLGTTIKAAGSQAAFYEVDHDFVLKFAGAAKNTGVRKFVIVTAYGANPKSKFFYNKVKGETERDLARMEFESLVIVQPSLLLGERSESRLAEKIFVRLTPVFKSLLIGPLAAYRPVEAVRVAGTMLAKAFSPTAKVERVINREIIESESRP